MDKEKVVILCGGMGTRLREETEVKPKALVKIGQLPILWHIMKMYDYYGHNEFILCLGYKGEIIKEYFTNFEDHIRDFTINPKTGKKNHLGKNEMPDWNITLVDTGINSNTGTRVKKIQKFIGEDNFMTCYSDGVSDIDIKKLADFHKTHNKTATVTSVLPPPRWSFLKIDDGKRIFSFSKTEKIPNAWIDGGFFAFKKDIFDYIPEEKNFMLEKEPMEQLAKEGNLLSFQHNGFWQCMDTSRDMELLNQVWESGNAPWKTWK